MSKEGVSIGGFIEVELVHKDTGETQYKKRMHNKVTPIGLQYILDRATNPILETGGDTFGQMTMHNAISNNNVSSGITTKSNTAICNTLINASDSRINNLSVKPSYLNTFDDDLNDDLASNDLVVGFASGACGVSHYNNNGIMKEGLVDFTPSKYQHLGNTNAKRWKYPADVANGDIRMISMIPASCLRQNNGAGFRFSKCLDKVNFQDSNCARTTAYCPPNIKGYTLNNEVLLNFTAAKEDGSYWSRWKYNIETGVISAVDDTNPFWVPISLVVEPRYPDIRYTAYNAKIVSDYYVEGDYLYIVKDEDQRESTYNNRIHTSVYVYSIETATLVEEVGQYNGTYFSGYIKTQKFFKKPGDTNLYVSIIIDDHSGAFDARPYTATLTKLREPYYDIMTLTQAFTPLGITIPGGVSGKQICFGNYGSSYIMYVAQDFRMYNDDDTVDVTADYVRKLNGYVFNDLSDIAGSITDCIYNLDHWSIPIKTLSFSGVLSFDVLVSNITNTSNDNTKTPKTYYDEVSGWKNIVNDDGIFMQSRDLTGYDDTTSSDVVYPNFPYEYKGLSISHEGWWGNVFSYRLLEEPITKTPDQVMYVTYGYEIDTAT